MGLNSIAGAAAQYAGIRPEAPAPLHGKAATGLTPAPNDVDPPKSRDGFEDVFARGELDDAAVAVNEKLFRINRRMVLYAVEGTNEIAAKIVDTTTNEVVGSIPPEALLKFRARLREMRGVIVDKGA